MIMTHGIVISSTVCSVHLFACLRIYTSLVSQISLSIVLKRIYTSLFFSEAFLHVTRFVNMNKVAGKCVLKNKDLF